MPGLLRQVGVGRHGGKASVDRADLEQVHLGRALGQQGAALGRRVPVQQRVNQAAAADDHERNRHQQQQVQPAAVTAHQHGRLRIDRVVPAGIALADFEFVDDRLDRFAIRGVGLGHVVGLVVVQPAVDLVADMNLGPIQGGLIFGRRPIGHPLVEHDAGRAGELAVGAPLGPDQHRKHEREAAAADAKEDAEEQRLAQVAQGL